MIWRDLLLWHRPGSFARSAAYALLIIAASLVLVRSAWTVDGAVMLDGHAIVSLDLAINDAFCGIRSSFSPRTRIPMDLAADMSRRHVPLRTLIAGKTGSIEAYCPDVIVPFVNNENSLMLLETAILRARPGVSLSELGQVLHGIRIFCVAAFVLLLMDLGASLWLGLATMMCGLMLLQAMPDHVYSNYPFLFSLVLFDVALFGFAAKYRWTDRTARRLLFGVIAGLVSAFIAHMRTSYLPIAVLFFTLALVDQVRSRGRLIPLRGRLVQGLALAACFVAAYESFQIGLITSRLPSDRQYNLAHPIGHPLVLALAIPENAFSREQGIHWLDEVGPRLAARVDPGADFMGPRYNAALLQFYRMLWRTHPREMLGVYRLKFSVAGADMLRVLRRSPGSAGWAIGVLLTPLGLLPDGFWLLGVYAATAGGAFIVYYRHNRTAAFALGLLSAAACLVHLESAIIFSIFVKQYHNLLAFYVLFLSLLGAQALVNAAWARWPRPRRAEAQPA
jgi:hypothetical protein